MTEPTDTRPDGASPNDARPAAAGERFGSELTAEGLSLLADLGRAISSFSDRDELLRFTLDTALALLGSESGSLYLYDPDTEELVLTIARGPDREQRLGLRQRLGDGVAGQVALERKPILVTDIGTDERFDRPRSRRYETNSFICAPLLVSNELAGLITITMKRSGDGDGGATPFTGDELRVLSILAGHAASAIENLRLYHELRQLNRQLEQRIERATEELSAANTELGALQAFNESILESIPQGVAAFDRRLKLTFVNRALGDVTSTAAGDSVAGVFAALEADRQQCPWRAACGDVLGEGARKQFERVECGGSRVFDFDLRPLLAPDGGISGGLLTIEDRTRRAAMERKLANSERLASVGQLAARVAHELNNPLDGIMRFINLSIRVQPPDSPAIKYLQQSRTGLMRMVAIIRDLLKFSRSTFGAMETTEIDHLLEEALKSLTSKAAAQGIEVRTAYAQDLPPVRAGNLFQVFYNLMTNAIDAMPDGGVLSLRSGAEDGMIEVAVTDTGTGIPQDLRDHIFEPFFTTKETGKGTGLGLAICRDIVGKYDGTLSVTSEPGRGSKFVVRIPMET